MAVRILVGDALSRLRELPDASVHMCMTSPPYWGLRAYQGGEGMVGLEDTFEAHLENLVAIFREVRRVLRDDGTLWLNYGDAYAANRGYQVPDSKHRAVGNVRGASVPGGFKPKDLMLMPARVAMALQADGWWLRSEIIYHKLNPMPESVTDRPTNAHEKVFLFAKAQKYFYDTFAVREGVTGGAHPRRSDGSTTLLKGHDPNDRRGIPPKKPPHDSIEARRARARWDSQYDTGHTGLDDTPRGQRNLRNVWSMTTGAGFPGAHFATFPPSLVEPCVKAGSSEKGACPECGAPWARETERVDRGYDGSKYGERAVAVSTSSGGTARSTLGSSQGKLTGSRNTTGWAPTCNCDAGVKPSVILDCFAGSGTVGLVADRLGRDAVLIEISPEYADMAKQRIEGDAPMFTNVTMEDEDHGALGDQQRAAR